MAEEKQQMNDESGLINCLVNKKITVRYLTKPSNLVKDPKHVLAGGLAEGAKHDYVVPMLQSNGAYYNVLTNDEKNYLEYIMGMEKNALSIYKTTDNFWDDFKVTLTKDPLTLDLSVPMDYIKYKVLLANKSQIADSLQTLEDRPQETYRFVLVAEDEEDNAGMQKLNSNMESYLMLGRYKDDKDTLCTILEVLEGRPVSDRVKIETILTRLYEHITNNAKLFLKLIKDPLLPTRVLIRQCVAAKLILKKGNYYYLASDNSPLCDANAEPTIGVAAAFLSNAKRSDLKCMLEGKLKAK